MGRFRQPVPDGFRRCRFEPRPPTRPDGADLADPGRVFFPGGRSYPATDRRPAGLAALESLLRGNHRAFYAGARLHLAVHLLSILNSHEELRANPVPYALPDPDRARFRTARN